MGFGHTLELAQQKIIQALTRILFVHAHCFYLGQVRIGIDPYNVFH
jgi:hypothetical protein